MVSFRIIEWQCPKLQHNSFRVIKLVFVDFKTKIELIFSVSWRNQFWTSGIKEKVIWMCNFWEFVFSFYGHRSKTWNARGVECRKTCHSERRICKVLAGPRCQSREAKTTTSNYTTSNDREAPFSAREFWITC